MEKQDPEAGKKLVSDSAVTNSKDIEVKFIPPDPRNGDAKIDIENLKCVFTGMGKEELMKYADDPFWVRIRWFLFILFWFIWVAMLVGAIGIIVLAPKCTSAPRSWLEMSPIYKIDARTSGKLKDIQSKLDDIKMLGVKNLVLTSALKSESKAEPDDFIEDFESIDPAVGSAEDFEAFIKAAKSKDLKVQLAFVPNHSSDKHAFFQDSIKKVEPYTSFYVWKPRSADKSRLPNNWTSVNELPAWTYNDVRGEFYLHRFSASQPDFNFHDSRVVEYFKNVFRRWLDKGVSGFYLEKVQYMIEEMSSSEDVRTSGIDISASNDPLTIKSPELVNILETWNSSVVSNCSGVLTIEGLISKTEDTIKLNSHPVILSNNFSATNLMQAVTSSLNSSSWPVWQFTCARNSDSKQCWNTDLTNGLQMVSLLLPGTPVINAGEELSVGTIKPIPGAQPPVSGTPVPTVVSDDSAQLINVESSLIFQKLTDARNSPTFEHGLYEIKVLKDSVFVYTRIKSGNPGYLVAFNPTVETVAVNFSELRGVPDELSVEAWSRPRSYFTSSLQTELNSRDVTIPPGNALMCTFVPKN